MYIWKRTKRNWIETEIKGLEKRNITGHYCETAADAVKTIESLIAEGSQVSWGGSSTLNEIGIKDVLKAGNYDVNDPMDPSVGRDESTMRRKKALTCDAFLASLNAITMDGEIVNVDGTGNRIAAIAFGPDKVILVAGVNKGCHRQDLDGCMSAELYPSGKEDAVCCNRKMRRLSERGKYDMQLHCSNEIFSGA